MTPSMKAFLVDLGERVGATFLQVFIVTVLAARHVLWADTAAIAGFAAFASFLTTVLAWLAKVRTLGNPYLDLALRVVLTFGQTLLGYVVAAGTISALEFNWSFALKAALAAAGAAILKGLSGFLNPQTQGASVFLLRHPTPALPQAA